MIKLMQNPFFWIMAVSINFLFNIIRPFVKEYFIPMLNRILPENMDIVTDTQVSLVYKCWVFGMSLLIFYFMKNYDSVPVVENSLVLSALWLAFMATLVYDIGYKFIWEILKKKFIKTIEE